MRGGIFYGWWLVGVALLAQMVGAGAIVYSYSVVVLPFGDEFAASRMQMMLGITVMPLAGALLAPFLGRALDRYSLKAFMITGALALPLGFLILSFTTAIWQVPLVYALFMAFASQLMGPLGTSTLLARWFHTRLGLAMGIAAIGTSVGGFLFPPFVGWLIDTFEWRMAFRVLAITILVLILPIMFLIVNRPGDRQLTAHGASDSTTLKQAGRSQLPAQDMLKNRNFWLVALVMGILFGVYTALLGNLVPFAVDLGISKEQGALLISLIAVFGMAGKLVFGAIADRVDLRWGLGTASVMLVIGLGFYLEGSYLMLLLGSVAVGLAAGGMLPVWGALLAKLFGVDNYGQVMGLMSPCIMPLTVIAPPLAGHVQDVTGNYHVAFIIFISALLVAIFMLFAIRMQESADSALKKS